MANSKKVPECIRTLSQKWETKHFIRGSIVFLKTPYSNWVDLMASFREPPSTKKLYSTLGRASNWDANRWNPFNTCAMVHYPAVAIGDMALFGTEQVLRGTWMWNAEGCESNIFTAIDSLINSRWFVCTRTGAQPWLNPVVEMKNNARLGDLQSYYYPYLLVEGVCLSPDRGPIKLRGIHIISPMQKSTKITQ